MRIEIGTVERDGWFADGFDVSWAQSVGVIDWAAAGEQCSWAMIRLSGGDHVDTAGAAHYAAARSASIPVGGYHWVSSEPADSQIAALSRAVAAVGVAPGDIAVALDLEPPPGKTRVVPAVAGISEALIEWCDRELGGCWIYTSPWYWRELGRPGSWVDREWWVPWYPRGLTAPEQAQTHQWPARPGVPTPAAWQYGALPAEWAGGQQIDRNIAKRLPFYV